jgi:glucosamine-6-phosphate deaminase
VEVIIVDTPAAIGTIVADWVEELLNLTDAPTVGLATGSSPLSVYAELVRRHREGRISFDATTMFLLDEYVGLSPEHPRSNSAFIRSAFTDHIDVRPSAVHFPAGDAGDPGAAGREYERRVAAAGGIDIQLLGVGRNGHIGFNEPGSSLVSRTRLKTLTEETRTDNARFFDSPHEVPRHVLTQGVGTILEARHVVLVAAGVAKADAIAGAVEGPVTAICPASALQLHPRATVVVDEQAAANLSNADYYRAAYRHSLGCPDI